MLPADHPSPIPHSSFAPRFCDTINEEVCHFERNQMSTAAITTIVKMMEDLPEGRQEQVLEHLREYLADMTDEARWDQQFAQSQEQLEAAARRARRELQAGQAAPLDFDR